MSTNYFSDDEVIRVTRMSHPATPEDRVAGAPCIIGNVTGVIVEANRVKGEYSVRIRGIFRLPVTANSENINVGNVIHYLPSGGGSLSGEQATNSVPFGNALEVVTTTENTKEILVLVKQSGEGAQFSDVPGRMDMPESTGVAARSVNLRWTIPADEGGTEVTGYVVGWKRTSETSYTTVIVGGRNTLTEPISGLQPGTPYDFVVAATNDTGTGEYSPILAVSTISAVPSAPARPTRGAVTRDSVVINWGSAEANGAAINEWEVGFKTTAAISWLNSDTTGQIGSGVRSFTFDMLLAGTSYDFRVRARNIRGAGDWSPALTASTQPAVVPVAPAAPLRTSATTSSIRFNWSPPADDGGSSINSYYARRKETADTNWGDAFVIGTSTATNYTITGLLHSTSYDIQILARNDIGFGAWSESLTVSTNVATAPSQVATFFSSGITPNQIIFEWTAPVADGGSDITAYFLEVKPSTLPTWGGIGYRSFTNNPNTFSRNVLNLIHTTSYDARIAAMNDAGIGTTRSITVSTAAATVPLEMPAPRSQSIGTTGIAIIWDFVTGTDTGGSPITSYEARHKRTTESDFGTPVSRLSTQRNHSFNNLISDTSYDFQVRAINAVGSGDWSETFTTSTNAS